MSFVLDAVRDRPVALYMLDDYSLFQDYSGYNRVAMPSGTEGPNGASLVKGALFSKTFNDASQGIFESPVFVAGRERESFSLEVVCRPIIKTVGYMPQPYRENIMKFNPSASTTTHWAASNGTISTSNGGIRLVPNAGAPWTLAATAGLDGLAGESYISVSIDLRTNVGAVTIQVSNINNVGTATGNTSSNTTGLPVDTWARRKILVPLKTDTVSLNAFQVVGGAATGNYVEFKNIVVEKGDKPLTQFFDGYTPGYEWVGTANASVSRTVPGVFLTNMDPDPSFEGASPTSSFSAVTVASYVSSTDRAMFGTKSIKVTAAASSADGYATIYKSYAINDTLKPDTTYTFFAHSYSMPSNTGAGTKIRVGGGGPLGGEAAPTIATKGAWVRHRLVFSTSTSGSCLPNLQGSGGSGDVTYWDGYALIEGDVPDYFDGNSDGASWSGAANNSPSYFMASESEQQILGNAGQMDGITVNGTKVSFVTKYTNAPEARAEYDLGSMRKFHAVGVHTSGKNALYIDGELVDEISLTEAQQAGTYAASADLRSGDTNSSLELLLNAVGVYARALPAEAIKRHAVTVNDVPTSEDVVFSFGGEEISLDVNSMLDTSARTVTLNNATVVGDDEPFEFSDHSGVVINEGGSIVISPDTAGGTVTRTLGLWIKRNGPEPTISLTGTRFVNGETPGDTWRDDEWTFIVVRSASNSTAPITITGACQIGRVYIWDFAPDALEIRKMYRQFVGADITRLNDPGVVGITEGANSVKIYAHDWAIQSVV